MPYTCLLNINCFQGPSRIHFPQLPHPCRWPHTLRGPHGFQGSELGTLWAQPFPSLGGRSPQARGHCLWLLSVPWSQKGPLLLQRHIPRSPREKGGCTLPGGFPPAKGVDLPHSSDWCEREKKRGNVEDQKGKFLSFLWTQTGTNQVAQSWSFTPPPTCTDTIIKLFSKPMHLDNMILLLKKKKKTRKKSSITLVTGTG